MMFNPTVLRDPAVTADAAMLARQILQQNNRAALSLSILQQAQSGTTLEMLHGRYGEQPQLGLENEFEVLAS
jgi:hypothetical protein